MASYYLSTLTSTSSSYCRVESCPGGLYYYETIKINVYTSGNYSIRSNSSLDTFGYLYNSTFDLTYPSENLLQSNDDGSGSRQFLLSQVLQTMNDYILVATTFDPAITGVFAIIVKGPAAVSLSLINATGQWRWHARDYPRSKNVSREKYTSAPIPSLIQLFVRRILAVLEREPDDPMWLYSSFSCLASPPPIQSFYTSALTNNSLRFCRTGSCTGSLQYYQPIGFMTLTSGVFSIRSNGSLDSFGYIYNSTLHQLADASGAVMYNDDAPGSTQFLMKMSLQAMFNYTLVVTTYFPNVTGPFSVSATGRTPVYFSAL